MIKYEQEEENLGLLKAPYGSLILSPLASRERCEKLFADWMEDNFGEDE